MPGARLSPGRPRSGREGYFFRRSSEFGSSPGVGGGSKAHSLRRADRWGKHVHFCAIFGKLFLFRGLAVCNAGRRKQGGNPGNPGNCSLRRLKALAFRAAQRFPVGHFELGTTGNRSSRQPRRTGPRGSGHFLSPIVPKPRASVAPPDPHSERGCNAWNREKVFARRCARIGPGPNGDRITGAGVAGSRERAGGSPETSNPAGLVIALAGLAGRTRS